MTLAVDALSPNEPNQTNHITKMTVESGGRTMGFRLRDWTGWGLYRLCSGVGNKAILAIDPLHPICTHAYNP